MMAMSELTTDSNVETKANEFTTMEISTLDQESQQWDYAKIDKILKHSLEYHHHQLTINQKKLDMKSLPSEVSEHLDEALEKLNDAVNQGVVKVEVKNKEVQLIYPDSESTVKANDTEVDDVYYYDDANTMRAESAYMWFTKYGPKHWWKFWEWGAYVHFSEKAVSNARIVNLVAKSVNLIFLVKNLKDIGKIINGISTAHLLGNTAEVTKGLNELSEATGGFALDRLGDVVDILAIYTTVLSFFLSLTSAVGWILPLIELVAGMTEIITGKLIKADKGNGVKWQWACFIFARGFSAE